MTDNCKLPTGRTAPPRPLNDVEHYEQMATWAKALGHSVRMRIVVFLLSQDGCMCGDIVEHIDLAQSTVSQHLKMLKEAGVIQGSIDGSKICYCVNPLVLESLSGSLLTLVKESKNRNNDCQSC